MEQISTIGIDIAKTVFQVHGIDETAGVVVRHLAQEARAGLNEFQIPPEFGKRLFAYQGTGRQKCPHRREKRLL